MKNAELTRKIASRGAAALLVLAATSVRCPAPPRHRPPTAYRRSPCATRDLNLSTEAGAKALYRRVAFAAKQVCPADDIRDLSGLVIARACQQAAIERAVHLVNNPQFAAVYAAATRHG